MEKGIAIRVEHVSKMYKLYDKADHLWSEHRRDGKRGGTSADRGNRAPHDDGAGDPYRVRTSDGRTDRETAVTICLTGFVIAGFLHDR